MRRSFAALLAALALLTAPEAARAAAPSGPFAVTMAEEPSLPDHTVYRPVQKGKPTRPLPVVAFGNGGCLNVGNAYAEFLSEVASHGYVVIAPGAIDPSFTFNRAPGTPPPAMTRPGHIEAGIDWAVRESRRKGSPWRGRISPTRIAVMGMLCGGIEAIAAGAHPRAKTVMVLNSGIIRRGPGVIERPGMYVPATEADLPRLHTPMLYLNGGPEDHARNFADGDFAQIKRLPVFYANLPVGHYGTWREPRGGEMAKVAIAWLDWQLKGDAAARRMFAGPACGLCKDPRWTVRRKNLK